MKSRRTTISLSLIAAAALWGCLEPTPEPQGPSIRSSHLVSECGGFLASAEGDDDDAGSGYCDAERMSWRYDAERQTLVITDSRARLNCCGDRSMEAELVDGVLVITERDEPEVGGGRCDCECLFDLQITVEGVAEEPTEVRLERDVTDSGAGPALLWEGTIDPSTAAGEAIIDDSDVSWLCEPEPEPELTEITAEVSECGGFAAHLEEPERDGDDDSGYCDAEILSWSYDAESQTLELLDARVLLNCCGDHSMEIALVDGVYVATETDAPEGTGGDRCDCSCVFDFSVSAASVPEGTIALRLDRHVTDEGAPATVWEGSLDLTAGAGEELIDDSDVGIWCGEF